jgi:hypothetical protein
MKPIGMAGPIKIGCSVTQEKRLMTLDIWSPFPLEMLASAPGDHDKERALHYRFRDDLCHGEWFAASAELSALIDGVRATGQLPALEKAPYGKAKSRGRNPNRDKDVSLAKSRLTRRISRAENHAWSRYLRGMERPQWVNDAIASWYGPFAPYPNAELVEHLEKYIADLLSRPKETRSWRELWEEAQQRRKAAA